MPRRSVPSWEKGRQQWSAHMLEITAKLAALYNQYRQSQDQIPPKTAERFFPPLLVNIRPEWEVTQHRIAFIGQETQGWSWSEEKRKHGYVWNRESITDLRDFFALEDSVDGLMDAYNQFN